MSKVVDLKEFSKQKKSFQTIEQWIKATTPLLFGDLQSLTDILEACPDKKHPRYHEYLGVRDGRFIQETTEVQRKKYGNPFDLRLVEKD